VLPCFTNIKAQNTNCTPPNFYSDQVFVCPICCPFALTVSPTVQIVNHTIAIVINSRSELPWPCCTNSKPQSTDITPHNCYSDQRSVCRNCLLFYTNSKAHSPDCTPQNWYSDQTLVCPTCCPVALTVCPTIKTVHRTIAIVTNSLSALTFALLHWH